MTYEKDNSQNESDNFSKLPVNIMRAGVSMTARIVFAELSSYGLNIFPSYNKIADNLGISRRTAIRAVKELAEKGLIKKYTRIKENGGNTSNNYILPSVKNDAPPYVKNHTPPTVKNDTPNKTIKNNNNLFKINNITRAERAKNAAAAAQSAAELERNDKDMQLLSLFLQAKGATWFEFVRIKQAYYLRPRSKMAFKSVTNAEYNSLIDLIKEHAGSCLPLKIGQHNEKEVVINV